MKKFFVVLVLLGILAAISNGQNKNTENPSTFNIGGVLTDSESESHFRTTIAVSGNLLEDKAKLIKNLYLKHLNFDQHYVPRKVTYYDKTIKLDKNPIKTVFNVCDKLIEKRVSCNLCCV